MKEAIDIRMQKLAEYKKAFGTEHILTLGIINNQKNLYKNQGKLKEAKDMYIWWLAGKKKALGPEHRFALNTINNLEDLYID